MPLCPRVGVVNTTQGETFRLVLQAEPKKTLNFRKNLRTTGSTRTCVSPNGSSSCLVSASWQFSPAQMSWFAGRVQSAFSLCTCVKRGLPTCACPQEGQAHRAVPGGTCFQAPRGGAYALDVTTSAQKPGRNGHGGGWSPRGVGPSTESRRVCGAELGLCCDDLRQSVQDELGCFVPTEQGRALQALAA
jgi:hypothetical protein